MSAPANHGAGTRRPVVYGGRKIPRLSVRTLEDGTSIYEVRMRMPDGSQPRRVLEDVHTVTDAVRAVENLLADRNRGVEHENRVLNPTVGELLEEYLAALRARVEIRDPKLRIAHNTFVNHEVRARVHIKPTPLWRKRVADVEARDIRALIEAVQRKGRAPGTVGGVLETVSCALELAQENGYVTRNVARDLPRKHRPGRKRQNDPRYLTKGEVEALLAATTDRYRPIFACLAFAALRIGETLGLQWECIDFKADEIVVRQQVTRGRFKHYPKSASSATTVPLLPALKAELLAHRSRMAEIDLQRVRPEAFAFTGTHGQFLLAGTTLSVLKRAGSRAGLNPEGEPPVGQHDLRHSACTMALQYGASPEQVAELMRHADSGLTMRVYAGLNAETKGAAFRKLLDAGFGA